MLLREIPAFAQQYPGIEIVLVNVDEPADIGEKGVDLLLRGSSLRKRGGTHADPQGLVIRKLFQSKLLHVRRPNISTGPASRACRLISFGTFAS
jgi:DNA-binding transcriptional LysR family regulator